MGDVFEAASVHNGACSHNPGLLGYQRQGQHRQRKQWSEKGKSLNLAEDQHRREFRANDTLRSIKLWQRAFVF